MMASASIVIEIHGAALGNIVFCPSGTQVLELFPEYFVQAMFRPLAARAGLDYGFVPGTSFEYENSRREPNSAWDQDFDTELLERAVKFLVARDSSRCAQ